MFLLRVMSVTVTVPRPQGIYHSNFVSRLLTKAVLSRSHVARLAGAHAGVAVAVENACAASNKVLGAVPFSSMRAGVRE